MKQTDRDKAERVRSAKVWLDKAEESFRSSSDVRAEHTRRKRQDNRKRKQ